MTHTVFIDLDSHVATASATGTAAPDVPLKHLTKQTLAFAFHSGGTVSAVTGWSTGRVVIKATPTSDVLLLDTTLAATGSTTSTRYSAEWAAVDCDSAALRTLIGASVEPLDVFAEIQWTADSGTHAVSFPIQIVPTFNLPEDDPPDPTADASWTWLKARLAAGDDIAFADNETTKVRTIAVASGIDAAKIADGTVSDAEFQYLNGVTSALQTQLDNKQPLDTELTAFAALANASGVLTNNGSGTLSYTGTTTGGMAGDDDGKVPVYFNSGWLMSNMLVAASTGNTSPAIEYGPTSIGFVEASGTFAGVLQWPTITANRTITLPNVTGTVVTTGNLSAITETGTVTSGTWSGSFGAVSGANLTTLNAGNLASGTVPTARLGSGTANSTTYLRGDNTWQTISSGLTIGTTTITSGTSGRVLYNNGGVVGELTPTGTGNVVQAASPSLSGDVRVVDGSNYLSIEWTGFGAYDNAVGIKYRLNSADPIVSGGAAMQFGALGAITWQSTTRQDSGVADLQLWRHAAGSLMQRVGTSAQQFMAANTWTSATNYEAAVLDWQTTANTLRIGTDVGSGGGTSRAMSLITGGTARINIGASGELGFFGATAIAKPSVTGAHGANAALQSLLTALVNLGLITDSTS